MVNYNYYKLNPKFKSKKTLKKLDIIDEDKIYIEKSCNTNTYNEYNQINIINKIYELYLIFIKFIIKFNEN